MIGPPRLVAHLFLAFACLTADAAGQLVSLAGGQGSGIFWRVRNACYVVAPLHVVDSDQGANVRIEQAETTYGLIAARWRGDDLAVLRLEDEYGGCGPRPSTSASTQIGSGTPVSIRRAASDGSMGLSAPAVLVSQDYTELRLRPIADTWDAEVLATWSGAGVFDGDRLIGMLLGGAEEGLLASLRVEQIGDLLRRWEIDERTALAGNWDWTLSLAGAPAARWLSFGGSTRRGFGGSFDGLTAVGFKRVSLIARYTLSEEGESAASSASGSFTFRSHNPTRTFGVGLGQRRLGSIVWPYGSVRGSFGSGWYGRRLAALIDGAVHFPVEPGGSRVYGGTVDGVIVLDPTRTDAFRLRLAVRFDWFVGDTASGLRDDRTISAFLGFLITP